MKKYILLSIIILSTSFYTHAQLPGIPKVSFTLGPKGGFTMSKLTTNEDTLSNSFQNGFEAGLFFRLCIGRIYLQPEVMYVTKGGIFDSKTGSFREEINLQSIDIPVMLGMKFGSDMFNFRIHGGPVFGFVIDKKMKSGGIDIPKELFDQRVKNSSLGLQLGAGVDVSTLSLDIRYEWGFDNMFVRQPTDPDLKWKQRMFVVGLALKLL